MILETNRLLPVLFSLHKKCTERCELDIGELKPLVIEKDTPIGLPIFALHNDPNYWTDCDTFEPERFLNKEDADAKAKGIFLPFGEGPRMCPGE